MRAWRALHGGTPLAVSIRQSGAARRNPVAGWPCVRGRRRADFSIFVVVVVVVVVDDRLGTRPRRLLGR